jgi:O-antigen ligase
LTTDALRALVPDPNQSRASAVPYRWSEPLLFASLLLWGIGVQVAEVIAAIGGVGCVMVVVANALHSSSSVRWGQWLRSWAPLWAFLLWAIFAPALAGRPPSATGAMRVGAWLGVPLAAQALMQIERRRYFPLLLAIGITALLSCALSALQYFGAWPPESAFQALAWTRHPFYRAYEQIPGSDHRFMGVGLLFHRLKFADVTGLVVIFAVAIGLRQRGARRWLALGIAVIGWLSIFAFAYARAASFALLVGIAVAATLSQRSPRLGSVVAGLLALTAATLITFDPPLRARLLSSATLVGSGERPELIATGLRAIEAHPLVGVGLGRFRPSDYGAADTPIEVLEHRGLSHNQFVTLGAETGVPGLALFLLLILWLARKVQPDPIHSAAGFGSLVFFVLLSMVHDTLFHLESAWAFALAFGAALAGESALKPMSRR